MKSAAGNIWRCPLSPGWDRLKRTLKHTAVLKTAHFKLLHPAGISSIRAMFSPGTETALFNKYPLLQCGVF